MTPEKINAARAWLSEHMDEVPREVRDILEATLELAMEHVLERLEYERHF